MNNQYKILCLEDVSPDVEQIRLELSKFGLDFELCVADTELLYVKKLEDFLPDVVICNHALRAFPFSKACTLLKSRTPEVPFIIATDTLTEDVAMAPINGDADDYIFKSRLTRLPHAIINAVEKLKGEKDNSICTNGLLKKEEAGIDIIADKITDQKIRESEARMAQAQAMAKVGSWEIDLKTLKVILSGEVSRILGIEDRNKDISFKRFIQFVHPEDKDIVKATFSESLESASDNIIQHRIRNADGNIKFVEERWHFEKNNEGKVVKAVGTIQDITTQRKVAQWLQESEAKYRSIIESSMDAILLTLKSGEVLAANQAACDIFQMTNEDLCNSLQADIFDVTDPQLSILLEERDLTGRAKGEINFIRQDKTTFAGEISSVVFANAFGEEMCSVTIRDITDRKNFDQQLFIASNELQQALNGLNKIMDSSLDVICAVDADGYFRKVSAASEAVWGYKPEELMGKPLIDFVYKGDNTKTQNTANQVMQGKNVNHFENRYVRKDGTLVPIEWTARWDEKDQIRYGVARDVTEKKRLEAAFEAERLRFQDIFLQAPCIMGILNGPDHIFESANTFCLQFLGRNDIIGKPISELLPDSIRQRFIKTLDEVYNTGETFTAYEEPIKLEFDVAGEAAEKYLNIINQVNKNILGETVGILFFAIDVTEQVISRKKNEESEKKYRQIVELAQEGIWLIDADDVTTFVNNKMSDILGYPFEEMVGRKIFDFMDEEGRNQAYELMENKATVGSQQFFYKFLTKQGKELWALISSNPVFNSEGIYNGSLAMLTDMTEIKQAEDLLQRSEERYRTLFEQNLAGFYQSTLEGKIINCNDAFAHMLKYDSAKDIMQANAANLYFNEGDRSEFIKNVLAKKHLHNYEGISKCKDGSALYFLENVSVHLDAHNEIDYFDGIMIDITEKRQAELQLKESNERFTQVSKATFDVIWDWDIANNLLYLGDRFEELFGYEENGKGGGLNRWSDHIHPEDKERVLKSIFSKVNNEDENAWVEEYRYICADGRIAFVLNRGIFIKSGASRMIGAMQDITGLKELENLLQKTTSLAQIGSWEFDVIKDEMYWSTVTKKIHELGDDYIPEIQTSIDFYKKGENRKTIFDKFNNAIERGVAWDNELLIITAKGNEKWIRVIGETEFVQGQCVKVYGSLQDIHQRKVSEIAVIHALNEKDTILESIGDAFFAVDNNWTVTYWNSQAETILSKSKTETLGENLWEIFKSSVGSASYEKYHDAIANQEVIQFEDFYPDLQKWYEISAYPSENGLSVYFKDITDRKRTDEAVRASEQVRMLIMDSAMDAIICMNTLGIITVWNPQAERTFGWTEKEVVGKTLSETIVPPHLRDGQIRGLSKYLLSGYGPLLRKPFETTSLDANGKEFPVEVSVIPIKQKDSEFFCAFVRDISERKKAEADLNLLHQNLLEQSRKLQISNEELEKYAYVTSHDLQEPLRMVSSFLQLLQKKYESQLDDTAHKYINFAVDGAERMKTLILDLLEFSRISSEHVEHTSISLDEIVSKTLLSLKASIDETQAVIFVPPLPVVSGNEFQLLQLFQNLLSNAMKYKGAQSPIIEIGFTETDFYWQFSIKDNGLGIDPKYFEKIFVIFQRLHNKKDFKGTGIGLAICKKIVELHQGRIWVESSGSGSTFHFNLQKKPDEKRFLENHK